jgi:formylglycine-generating enzyme required for sulfatase activity
MKRVALCALAAIAITSIAIAQTQRDESAEEGEVPSASASVAPAPIVQVPRVFTQKGGMVFVTGGRFAFGSNDAKLAAPNEKPARDAVAKSFWIDRTEVTVGAYRACVETKKCAEPTRRSPSCTFDIGDDALPINCVRFQDADTFCRAQNKRLPTEIEWELAARGGGAYKYPWGNSSSSCLTAATLLRDESGRSCTGKHPARVGSYAMNVSPFGALDMAGNVEEWTSDWYVEHPAPSAAHVVTSGASHVLRGGGWMSRPADARTSSRNWGSAVEAGSNVGFRCARD